MSQHPNFCSQSEFQAPPSTTIRLITAKEAERRAGLSRSARYRAMDEGTFPKPVVIGKYTRRFVEHEVDDWIAARIAERDEDLEAGGVQ